MDDRPTPPSPEPPGEPPAVRASDAEREATAQFLQQSYAEGRLTMAEFDERLSRAYGATYRTDLVHLTHDLPGPGRVGYGGLDPVAGAVPRPVPAPRPDQSPAQPRDAAPHEVGRVGPHGIAGTHRVTGAAGPGTSLAVMSGCERTGVWTVAADHTAVAVMGGVVIDLRRAHLQSPETTIRAFAVWGGIEILVPDDLHLVTDGIGFMGGFAEESGTWKKDPRPVRQAPPGAPTVRVTGLALMGGVEVRRVPRPEH